MPRPWQRTPPWPYDARIGSVGVMLKPNQNGSDAVGRKTQRLDQVVPPTYEFVNSLPPYVERPFNFGPFLDGMGQKIQGGSNTRYRYAIDADLSIGGVARPGPFMSLSNPVTALGLNTLTTEVFQFLDFPMTTNRVPTVFALLGAYALQRTGSGVWSVSNSWMPGTGAVPWSMRRYSPQDASAPDALYVSFNTSGVYFFDGTTWTNCALPAGTRPQFVEVVGEEIWAVGGGTYGGGQRNQAIKATTDPRLVGSWSAPISLGFQDGDLSGVGAVADQLYLFTAGGVITLATTGTTYSTLFPELRRHVSDPAPIDAGGVRFIRGGWQPRAWNEALWFGYGDTSYRLIPGAVAQLEPVGLSRLFENDSPVRGRQVAFANDDWFGYYGYYDEAANTSYLVKHGTWVNTGASGPHNYVFNEVPNGAVRVFAGRRISALYVTGAAGANPVLLVGFGSGEIGEIVLPRISPDPALDGNCRFIDTGYVYYPDHDAGSPQDNKHWRGFTAVGPHLDATNYATIDYATEQNPVLTSQAAPFTQTGQRIATDGNLVSKRLSVRAVLHGDPGNPPQLTSLVLHEQIRPSLALEQELTVMASEPLARRDGMYERRSAAQIRAALKAASGANPTTVVLPDGSTQTVDFIDYAEALADGAHSYGNAWDITLRLVEFRTEPVYTYVDAGDLARAMPFTPAQSR